MYDTLRAPALGSLSCEGTGPAPFTCVASTNVQILTRVESTGTRLPWERGQPPAPGSHSQATKAGVCCRAEVLLCSQFACRTSSTKVQILACFTGANVQILTAEARQALLLLLLLPQLLVIFNPWKSLV